MATKKKKPTNKLNKQREIEQKKRNRRKKTVITAIIIIVIMAIGTYLFVSPSFKIQEVLVKGNEQITKEKIKELAGIKNGDNIFTKISPILAVKLKQNGGIEDVKINKKYPNKIEIEITERNKQYQIKTENNNYIYINEQGYIIDSSTEKLEIPIITGMDITEISNKKRLEEKDLNKMENILQIREQCKKIEISEKVTEIRVENEYILNLENDGIIINLGNATNLKDRMYYVSAILKQEAGNKGTIYVNGNLNEGFLPYFNAN